MTPPVIYPVGRWFSAVPLPPNPRSTIIHVPDPETTVSWVRVERVGPEVRDLEPGQRCLVSMNTGIRVTDELVLLHEQAALMLEMA